MNFKKGSRTGGSVFTEKNLLLLVAGLIQNANLLGGWWIHIDSHKSIQLSLSLKREKEREQLKPFLGKKIVRS